MPTPSPSDAPLHCNRCGNRASETTPLVPDLFQPAPFSLVCSRCWIDAIYDDPDVQFVLDVIDRFIPAEQKPFRSYHHTLEEWAAAVLSLRRVRDMRRFFKGYATWRLGPEGGWDAAWLEARDNIGCPLRDASWWRRLLWWWACGIKVAEDFHM